VPALSRITASAALAALAAPAAPARADVTSGVDAALFRSSYDPGGVFAVEGARLLPPRDLSLKALVGYGRSPIAAPVPGIGGATDETSDRILDYLITLDLAFGMSLTSRLALGIDVAAYRTATGDGYGVRGRYGGAGTVARRSTGLVALRPLTNIDPSASPGDAQAYLGDELAGPLDARLGAKLALIARPRLAVTAVGSVFLPFGDDEMLLGDRDLVFEPKLAAELRQDRVHATRLVANVGARIRRRSVLEGYDAASLPDADPSAEARVFLDVGSELVVGLGGVYELLPRASLAVEAQAFLPLPGALAYGSCRRYNGSRCGALDGPDYFAGAKAGDMAVLATAGVELRVTTDVTASLMVGTGQLGARGDEVRVTTGLIWAPQPEGAAAPGRGDKDGDGIPNTVDACPDEPEDKDSFEDEDGCPEPDNDRDGIPDREDSCANEPEDRDGNQDADGCPDRDNDGDSIPDATDRCADQPEDKDGFEDEDGCPDDDNDGDGIPDARDKCPNDAETVNGSEDEDGCPEARGTAGPEERPDRIDLKGARVLFGAGAGALAPPSKQLLTQVAAIIKARRLTIRVEVHVPLGIKSANAAQIALQKRKDKVVAQQRAKAILDYLVAQGVAPQQVQAVGIGSDRPLGTSSPTDPVNERVDFIKAQQGGAP
jgi:outer membrane protein OmpA-like peptidoglycan-associated protein